MKTLKPIITAFITGLLLSFVGLAQASIDVKLKTASGFEKLETAGYQQKTVFNLLFHQGKIGFSYDDVSGSPVATKRGGTETVQRWMSKAELKATQETGLLRGGRDGTHYVTDAANSSAQRARQRLALPQTPEVKVTLDVPKGVFSKPSKVDPAFNMPGGGMERTATGNVPVTIRRVQ